MRLILIKIFLALSVIVCGQTQQYLHNGFVAATDSGVWYLQDGFNEWVRFGVSIYDTIPSISTNDGEVSIFTSKYNYTYGAPAILYGDKLTYLWAYSSGQAFAKITNKFKIKPYQVAVIKYNIGDFSAVDFAYGFDFDNWGYYDSNIHIWVSDVASDNDSIFVVSCKGNDLKKYIVNYTSESVLSSSVPGLHSRPTDFHKICYNHDNDEFIIVSDSGIVYSYNKTTVTTLDTLDIAGIISPVSSFEDIVYNNGSIMVQTNHTNNSKNVAMYSLLNLKTSVYNSDNNITNTKLNISKYGDDFATFFYGEVFGFLQRMLIDASGSQIGNLKNYYNSVYDNRIVFDLDYINN